MREEKSMEDSGGTEGVANQVASAFSIGWGGKVRSVYDEVDFDEFFCCFF